MKLSPEKTENGHAKGGILPAEDDQVSPSANISDHGSSLYPDVSDEILLVDATAISAVASCDEKGNSYSDGCDGTNPLGVNYDNSAVRYPRRNTFADNKEEDNDDDYDGDNFEDANNSESDSSIIEEYSVEKGVGIYDTICTRSCLFTCASVL